MLTSSPPTRPRRTSSPSGLEPRQRATYDRAMDRVVRGIAAAAQAQPADGTALAALEHPRPSLRPLVEQALGLQPPGPAGRGAVPHPPATWLRADAVPVLTALVEATARSAGET